MQIIKKNSTFQVLEYMYTDMQMPERYEYAKEVYKSFCKRSSALTNWIKEVKFHLFRLSVIRSDGFIN
jgi:UV DNA damage repair endonuclease